jgi:AcrR family transcriptional regulator
LSQPRTDEKRQTGGSGDTTRERLLSSMTTSVAENGYGALTIAEVVERAGLETDDFYRHFPNKEACALAAYDWVVGEALSRFGEAYASAGASSWPLAVRRGLRALLKAIAEHPDAAKMATLEVPPIGPEAHRRYRAMVERFATFMSDGREYAERGDELPEQVEIMALGGAEVIIFDEISAGRTGKLPEMLREILFTLLVPFLGPEEAAAEMQAAAAPAG